MKLYALLAAFAVLLPIQADQVEDAVGTYLDIWKTETAPLNEKKRIEEGKIDAQKFKTPKFDTSNLSFECDALLQSLLLATVMQHKDVLAKIFESNKPDLTDEKQLMHQLRKQAENHKNYGREIYDVASWIKAAKIVSFNAEEKMNDSLKAIDRAIAKFDKLFVNDFEDIATLVAACKDGKSTKPVWKAMLAARTISQDLKEKKSAEANQILAVIEKNELAETIKKLAEAAVENLKQVHINATLKLKKTKEEHNLQEIKNARDELCSLMETNFVAAVREAEELLEAAGKANETETNPVNSLNVDARKKVTMALKAEEKANNLMCMAIKEQNHLYSLKMNKTALRKVSQAETDANNARKEAQIAKDAAKTARDEANLAEKQYQFEKATAALTSLNNPTTDIQDKAQKAVNYAKNQLNLEKKEQELRKLLDSIQLSANTLRAAEEELKVEQLQKFLLDNRDMRDQLDIEQLEKREKEADRDQRMGEACLRDYIQHNRQTIRENKPRAQNLIRKAQLALTYATARKEFAEKEGKVYPMY